MAAIFFIRSENFSCIWSTSHQDTSYRVSSQLAFRFRRNRFSKWRPWRPSRISGRNHFSYFWSTINVKKIAFGKKEHTTDKKMGVSVLLRLFITSNEVCNTAFVLQRIHEQNSTIKYTSMGPMIPKEMKYYLYYGDVWGNVLPPPHGTNTSCSV